MASLGCIRVTGPISEGLTQISIHTSGEERIGTFLISECRISNACVSKQEIFPHAPWVNYNMSLVMCTLNYTDCLSRFLCVCVCVCVCVCRAVAKGYEAFRIRYPGLVHYHHTKAGMWGNEDKANQPSKL